MSQNRITNLSTSRSTLKSYAYWVGKHWFRSIMGILCLYVFFQKDVQVQFNLSGQETYAQSVHQMEMIPYATNTTTTKTPQTKPRRSVVSKADEERFARQQAYIKQFASAARKEMDRFGIPASITLAQGLLESGAGRSSLATRNNNHFGIKCFSKSCKKGHCSNHSDDSHKDFFRIYTDAQESYRAHSHLLTKDRYRHLLGYDIKDYQAWAKGLQKAGYATDPSYANKLINLIEQHGLYALDR